MGEYLEVAELSLQTRRSGTGPTHRYELCILANHRVAMGDHLRLSSLVALKPTAFEPNRVESKNCCAWNISFGAVL